MKSAKPRSERDPVWVPHTQILHHHVERDLRCWLLDPTSLTQRLIDACGSRFRVQVEFQGWSRPRLDEDRALSMHPSRRAMIREVHLLCGDEPWVFARTVIPVATLRGPQRRLAKLGNKPLGAVLFTDPGMRRGPVEIACFRPGTASYSLAVQGLQTPPAQIWGRRSLFHLGGKPLLVSEIFLPTVGGCDGHWPF